MRRDYSEFGFLTNELLVASIGLILLALFAGISRDREPNLKREKAVLRSIAGEFRRGPKIETSKPASIFHSNSSPDELSANLSALFTDVGAIAAPAAEELAAIADRLSAGAATLKIILRLETLDEDKILKGEEQLRRLREFVIAAGAPKFSVASEISFGGAEELILRIKGSEERIQWQ